MGGSPLLKALFLLLLLSTSCTAGKSSTPDFVPSEYLGVPASEFVGTVRSTIDIIRQVISMVSQFAGGFGDFRLTNAISDCLDLMDLSTDQLSWTLSASQNPNGKDNSTGNVSADMKTWLSGALINQDTCKEGLDGTNSIVKNLIAGSLDQVTSLVYDILSNVKTPPTTPPKGAPSTGPGGGKGSGSGGRGGGRGGRKLIVDDHQFPGWLRSHDRNLLQAANGAMADAVVAADGTGNFTSIKDAVHAAPEYSTKRFVIYVKRGVYKEYVEISKKKWNIMMIGDGVNVTIISGNRNFIDGWTTYRSATFAVKGQGFIARDITFENTAGPEKHQAVAFRSDSDLSVLYRCAFRGYQDTLYAHSQRQFYRECIITGTVDFIFGDGTVVFQNCQIQARKGLPNQKNTITAQGRKEPVENTGFSIQFCNISVEPDVLNSTQTYLGRPWKLYSRTVIMQSYISNSIRPEGWLEWNGDFALNTLFYGEYMNYGPGSGLGARVKWPGYRVFNSSVDANNFTVSQFIIGNTWLPSTGVRYTAGLAV
ncbi:Pectinesterase/pectinesterase inhibitor PPE8B [Sesamum alatum]|uniref:Pectinesterase n=1 Tax=Sesamum alatum TaxID=300844 RepID=A0AAE1YM80_9LAMI|nr:Pectinesterase/pectinesterase inhibitor PPE8B [Sesamum alatum]